MSANPHPQHQQQLFEVDSRRNHASTGFSVRDFFSFLFKHKWIISICLVVVSVITFIGASRQPKTYSAIASVWVKSDQQGTPSFFSGVAAYRDTQVQESASRRLETEMSALLNPSSVEAVIRKNGLRPELLKLTPIQVLVRPYIPALTRFGVSIRELFNLEDDEPPVDELADTVKAFMGSIVMAPLQSKGAQDTSNIIEIKLSGTNPATTRTALISLLEEYIALSTRQELERGEKARAALQTQTAEAQTDLDKISAEIVSYVTGSAAKFLAADNAAVAAPANAQDAAGGVRQPSPSVTAKLRADTEEAQSRLDSLREVYTDSYPLVAAARRERDRLSARMQSEGRSSSLASANLEVLERRRGIANERFVELHQKLDQINLSLKIVPTEVQGRLIRELPRLAIKDSGLLKIIMILIGPVAGLCLGLALASLLEFGDRRMQNKEAVARYLGLETLAVLPSFVIALPARKKG
jgi:uncharacterized protein involved in exopolysaccharide biosynthesis